MRFSAAGAALSALLWTCVFAEEPVKTPLERLKELEREMEALKKDLGEGKEALPAAKEKAPRESSGLKRLIDRTRIGGYLDLEFEEYSHETSHFDNHHLILRVSSYLHERIFVNAEIEYEHGGSEVRIEQGYVDFLLHDALNFRGGVFIQPIGKLNTMHDSDLRDLTLRPLTTTLIIPTTWSDAGVGVHGSFFLGGATLNYEAYLAQGLKDGDFSVAEGLHDAGENLELDNNQDKAVSARLELVAFDGNVTAGVSGYEGNYDPENRKRLYLYAADLTIALPIAKEGTWISGPLEFRFEAARFSAERGLNSAGEEVPHRGIGAFAQVSFHFFPPFLLDSLKGLGFEHPTFTLVGLWDACEIDAPDGPHNNHQRRLSLGLNFRPIEQVVIKVEYIREDSDEIFGTTERRGVAASIAVGF
ncbi:MAG: hypothetical protein K8T20_19510 [Planctomycetes bacterium]|nr:hypothetical protein [Planctomycetota bacterium]